MSYQLKTQSGINFFTCSSAFQKFIRRGMEHETLWFGTELYISGYEEYVWFRMRVMACEDVGLANHKLTVQIQSLYQVYTDFKKKKNKHGPERLPFVNALLLLVRSEKSRIVDNLLCEYIFLRETVAVPNLDKPEYDFVWDMHTLKGKKMGRGNDHFYEEAGKIINEPDWLVEEEYKIRDRVWGKYIENESNENFHIPNLFDDTEN